MHQRLPYSRRKVMGGFEIVSCPAKMHFDEFSTEQAVLGETSAAVFDAYVQAVLAPGQNLAESRQLADEGLSQTPDWAWLYAQAVLQSLVAQYPVGLVAHSAGDANMNS